MKALILLPVALGIGALVLLARPKKASASTAPAPAPEGKAPPPEPAPPPAPSQGQAAQQGGAECRQRYQEWSSHAKLANDLCKDAVAYNEEWWNLEDLRLAGDPFFKQEHQDQILAAYDKASRACDLQNANSLAAMKLYEDCMRNLGLDPTKPSAATTGYKRRRRYR